MTADDPPSAPRAKTAPPLPQKWLVVDLDGTLVRTDTLRETLLHLLARRPLTFVMLLRQLLQGLAQFKSAVAEEMVLDGARLPYNSDVIELIRSARAKGQNTALVTASHQRQADAIAAAIGLFDEVHGTTADVNLKGQAKAAFLRARFGNRGFAYAGDSLADVPVWEASEHAITVGAPKKLRNKAEAVSSQTSHIGSHTTSRVPALLRAMRPHQWSKNVLLFLPMVAAHDFGPWFAVAIAFAAFCATASAVYVINDLIDLADDRAHPRKRERPFASGALSVSDGVFLCCALLTFAAALTVLLHNAMFALVLTGYLVATFAYSLALKRKLLADVIILASLYTIRILAGGVVANIALSPWLLAFSMFFFLGLASVKRQAELVDQLASGRTSNGRGYVADDLPIVRSTAVSSSHVAILVLALYINSDEVSQLYTHPEVLWLVCPILLYWQLRMVALAHRAQMSDDPIVFAFKDWVSALSGLLVFGVVFFAT